MAAGLQVDKSYLNAKTGGIAVQLRSLMYQVDALQRGLTGWDGTRLVTDLGFTQADSNDIVAALTTLVKLKSLLNGTDTLPTAINLWQYLDKVTGLDG